MYQSTGGTSYKVRPSQQLSSPTSGRGFHLNGNSIRKNNRMSNSTSQARPTPLTSQIDPTQLIYSSIRNGQNPSPSIGQQPPNSQKGGKNYQETNYDDSNYNTQPNLNQNQDNFEIENTDRHRQNPNYQAFRPSTDVIQEEASQEFSQEDFYPGSQPQNGGIIPSQGNQNTNNNTTTTTTTNTTTIQQNQQSGFQQQNNADQDLIRRVKNQENQIRILTKKNKDLNNFIQEKNENIKKMLEAYSQEENQEIEMLGRQRDNVIKENNSLLKQMQNLEQKNLGCSSKNVGLQKKVDSLEDEIDRLKMSFAAAPLPKNDSSELISKNFALQNKLQNLENSTKNQTNLIRNNEIERESDKNEIRSLRLALQKVEADKSDLETEYKRILNNVDNMKRSLVVEKTNNTNVQQKSNQLANSLDSKVSLLEKKLRSLQGELSNEQQMNQSMKQSMKDQERVIESNDTHLLKQLNQLRAEKAELMIELDNALTKLQDKPKTVFVTKPVPINKENVGDLSQQLTDLRKEIITLQTRNRTLEEVNNIQNNHHIVAMVDEVPVLRKKISLLEQELAKNQHDNNTELGMHLNLNGELVENLKRDNKRKDVNERANLELIASLIQKNEDLKKEIRRLKLENGNNFSDEEREEFKAEILDLKQRLKKARNFEFENKRLINEMYELRLSQSGDTDKKMNDELRLKIKTLQDEVSDLKISLIQKNEPETQLIEIQRKYDLLIQRNQQLTIQRDQLTLFVSDNFKRPDGKTGKASNNVESPSYSYNNNQTTTVIQNTTTSNNHNQNTGSKPPQYPIKKLVGRPNGQNQSYGGFTPAYKRPSQRPLSTSHSQRSTSLNRGDPKLVETNRRVIKDDTSVCYKLGERHYTPDEYRLFLNRLKSGQQSLEGVEHNVRRVRASDGFSAEPILRKKKYGCCNDCNYDPYSSPRSKMFEDRDQYRVGLSSQNQNSINLPRERLFTPNNQRPSHEMRSKLREDYLAPTISSELNGNFSKTLRSEQSDSQRNYGGLDGFNKMMMRYNDTNFDRNYL